MLTCKQFSAANKSADLGLTFISLSLSLDLAYPFFVLARFKMGKLDIVIRERRKGAKAVQSVRTLRMIVN